MTYEKSINLKKGMKVVLATTDKDNGAKKGDTVIITKAYLPGTDWEHIRVQNDKYSWRIGSSYSDLK